MKMQATVTFVCGKKYCGFCQFWKHGDVHEFCAMYNSDDKGIRGYKRLVTKDDELIRCPECLANAREVTE